MKYAFLTMLLFAMEAFPKGKLASAAGRRDRRPDGAAVAQAFREIHDSEFVDEMVDLYRGASGIGPDAFRIFADRGLGMDASQRCRRNRAFCDDLRSLVGEEEIPDPMKIDVARNYWKWGADSSEFIANEDRLIAAHGKERSSKVRLALVRELASTRESTIGYLERVCEQSRDSIERAQTARKLGQLADLAEQEGRIPLRDGIGDRLRKLHASKRLRLSDLGGARVMTRTSEGRDYLKREAEKDGYREWQGALWAIKDDLGYDYFCRMYRRTKSETPRDDLAMVARANLMDSDIPSTLKKDADKIEFLEIRSLAGPTDSLAKADSLIEGLLSDKNETVRFEAVKTAHACLKDTRKSLAPMWGKETSARIKEFLHQYGYAE